MSIMNFFYRKKTLIIVGTKIEEQKYERNIEQIEFTRS